MNCLGFQDIQTATQAKPPNPLKFLGKCIITGKEEQANSSLTQYTVSLHINFLNPY